MFNLEVDNSVGRPGMPVDNIIGAEQDSRKIGADDTDWHGGEEGGVVDRDDCDFEIDDGIMRIGSLQGTNIT